jgi:hypothetical protein
VVLHIAFQIDVHFRPVHKTQHGAFRQVPGHADIGLVTPVICLDDFQLAVRRPNQALVDGNILIKAGIDY